MHVQGHPKPGAVPRQQQGRYQKSRRSGIASLLALHIGPSGPTQERCGVRTGTQRPRDI